MAAAITSAKLPREGVDVRERLTVGVADDVAAGDLVGAPGRREAAGRHGFYRRGRSMDSAEQIDDTQQDGPSDEDQQRRVHDHADRFTSCCQVSPFH